LTWAEYHTACSLVVQKFKKHRPVADLGPGDFASLRKAMARKWGPARLANMIQYVRSVFRYGSESGLIGRPVPFGPDFKRPGQKVLRLQRASRGRQYFAPAEIHTLLAKAGPALKAMVLLAVNCGLCNADCGRLPLSALDLDNGWLDYPRPKTGIPRRCPLWPETVQALKEVLASRREPKDAAAATLVFLGRSGLPWGKDGRHNLITTTFGRLLRACGLNGQRGFYALRHTHRTLADGAKDRSAADHIMGHAPKDMASVYLEYIDDARLRAVSDHVRTWLFGVQPQPERGVE
jgi:integrase